jgi:hypothetical protein
LFIHVGSGDKDPKLPKGGYKKKDEHYCVKPWHLFYILRSPLTKGELPIREKPLQRHKIESGLATVHTPYLNPAPCEQKGKSGAPWWRDPPLSQSALLTRNILQTMRIRTVFRISPAPYSAPKITPPHLGQ